MKIVVFGDVHGNLVALEKLFKIENNKTDFFVSHGDVVNYGPWSNDCVSFLKSIPNIKLLKGNHENYYIKGFYEGKNDIANAFFEFCYKKIDSSLISEISTYEEYFNIPDFTIKHTIDNKYIFADTNIDDITINTNCIIGHSHQQYHLKKNNFDIYNTGSIGQNRELLNLSCYLKVDTDKKTVELKNFVHDIKLVINQMETQKYPQICLDYYKSKKTI
jgi:predicted phosphodiesterase